MDTRPSGLQWAETQDVHQTSLFLLVLSAFSLFFAFSLDGHFWKASALFFLRAQKARDRLARRESLISPKLSAVVIKHEKIMMKILLRRVWIIGSLDNCLFLAHFALSPLLLRRQWCWNCNHSLRMNALLSSTTTFTLYLNLHPGSSYVLFLLGKMTFSFLDLYVFLTPIRWIYDCWCFSFSWYYSPSLGDEWRWKPIWLWWRVARHEDDQFASSRSSKGYPAELLSLLLLTTSPLVICLSTRHNFSQAWRKFV